MNPLEYRIMDEPYRILTGGGGGGDGGGGGRCVGC